MSFTCDDRYPESEDLESVSDGMSTGTVRKDNPQLLAQLIYNLIATTMHTELLSPEDSLPGLTNRAQLASYIWEFCRRAIAN